ncbi:MAG: hypothetical protein GY847_14445 [Proteobacteria bacterium]|nr:hypothetical protein [Pseudomonadota bacterium]
MINEILRVAVIDRNGCLEILANKLRLAAEMNLALLRSNVSVILENAGPDLMAEAALAKHQSLAGCVLNIFEPTTLAIHIVPGMDVTNWREQ